MFNQDTSVEMIKMFGLYKKFRNYFRYFPWRNITLFFIIL